MARRRVLPAIGRMPREERIDRHGYDENRNWVGMIAKALLPRAIAQRAVTVRVSTDRERYDVGEPVGIEIVLVNRLPVPVTITTPRRRLWGWRVDGELEASDETVPTERAGNSMSFRGRERKRVRREWSGLFKRTGGETTRWVDPEPGTYEVEAFLALEGSREPSDATTIRIG